MTQGTRPVKYPPGKHPNSIKNLKPYKPGENGHGRVYPLKERLRHALDHPLKEPKEGAPHGDVIVYNTLKGAAELVPVAFRETWERVDGKVREEHVNVNLDVVFVVGRGYLSRTESRDLTDGDSRQT